MLDRRIRISVVSHALSAGGGISVGKNLVYSLQKALPDADYQLFVPEGLGYEFSILNKDRADVAFYQKQSLPKRIYYDLVYVRKKIKQFRPDAVLCLGNFGLNIPAAINYILCQDSHLFYPSRYYIRESFKNKLIKLSQKWKLHSDLKATDVLLLQTKTAENRVRKSFKYSGDIIIVPNAISGEISSRGETGGVPEEIEKTGDDKFKLFYLTRYYPHKNIELLVQVFDKYRNELQDVCLFITIEGSQHPRAKKLLSEIEKKGLGHSIINIGPVPQNRLHDFFLNMDALVMPSTLESFSATYLEAMHFGCPILTSDLDFSREICGDAAMYFDPWSADSLFSSIMSLKSDDQKKLELVESGFSRIQQHHRTWDEVANELAKTILDRLCF